MGVNEYKALLFLVSGLSFFTVMLLVLRLLSQRKELTLEEQDHEEWHGREALNLVDVIEETHNIRSFYFQRKNVKNFPHFHCGQFISFQIGQDPKVTRSYSISSLEQNRQTLQVSVKLLDGGVGSSWFHHLKIGDEVLAFPPSGHFYDHGKGSDHRILIAGGIGITPLLSIIQTNLAKVCSFKMTLFYGARTKEDLAFHDILTVLSKRHKNFEYYPILSNEKSWAGDSGFLTIDFIKKYLKDLNGMYFLCGPDVMSDPIIDALEEAGIDDDKIFNEKFVSPTTLSDADLPKRELTVRYLGQEYSYQGNNNILSFLEEQGESLAYSCRSGVCGSCKCKIKGPYQMLTDAGLTRSEKKAGYALACVAYPEADVEIDL